MLYYTSHNVYSPQVLERKPETNLVSFCAHIALRMIEKSMSKGESQSSGKAVILKKGEKTFSRWESVSDKTRKNYNKSPGKIRTFSEGDREECRGIASVILAKHNLFKQCECLGPHVVPDEVIFEIKEAIRGKHGLELNRYKNKRKIAIDTRGETASGVMDFDVVAIPAMAQDERENFYLENKKNELAKLISQVEEMMKNFMEKNGGRQWKGTLANDLEFFHSLIEGTSCGNGEKRTTYIERKKAFNARLQAAFIFAKSSEAQIEFKSFETLAAFLQA